MAGIEVCKECPMNKACEKIYEFENLPYNSNYPGADLQRARSLNRIVMENFPYGVCNENDIFYCISVNGNNCAITGVYDQIIQPLRRVSRSD